MKCVKCGTEIVPEEAVYCFKCGTRLFGNRITPDLEFAFESVRSIFVSGGTKVILQKSDNEETTVSIKAAEKIKQGYKASMDGHTLNVISPNYNVKSSSEFMRTSKKTYGIVREVDGITVNKVFYPHDASVVVTIKAPNATPVEIVTFGDLYCNVEDMHNDISIKAVDDCVVNCKDINRLRVNTGGKLIVVATAIDMRCDLHVGDLYLSVAGGTLNELFVHAFGEAEFKIDGFVKSTSLRIGTCAYGTIHTGYTECLDIHGRNDLVLLK